MKTGICLHWTAGIWLPNDYEKVHYHGGVFIDSGFARFEKWNNYELSLAHTWMRNSDLVGLTVCGMAGASPGKWGKFPITRGQVDSLVLATAEIAFIKGIKLSRIKTHAEWAIVDGYFGERWDLAELEPGTINEEIAIKTGGILRKRINDKIEELKTGKIKVRGFHYSDRYLGY